MTPIEMLITIFGPALSKAIAKVWLKDNELAKSAVDSVVDFLKKKGEAFVVRSAVDRLLQNVAADVSARISEVIALEFPKTSDNDLQAAIATAASLLDAADLRVLLASTNLEASQLEQELRLQGARELALLGGDAERLARLILRDAAAYIVAIAEKLPNFQSTVARELLSRTADILIDLTRIINQVAEIRDSNFRGARSDDATYTTTYSRHLVRHLDQVRLFGVRLVGPGIRDYGLSASYVPLRLSVPEGGGMGQADDLMRGHSRVLLLGEAGSGKSTLLQWIGLQTACKRHSDALKEWNHLTPIYVRLREFGDRPPTNLEALLTSAVPLLASAAPAGWAHRVLESGAMLLLDGLDEVPTSRRAKFAEWIADLSDTYPRTTVLLTTRPAAVSVDLLHELGRLRSARPGPQFYRFGIEPLSIDESESLISNWHYAVSRELVRDEDRRRLYSNELSLRQALLDRPAIRSLASVPLLCAMLCALNWDRRERLPDRRMELYRIVLETLLEHRDIDRRIEATTNVQLSRATSELVLEHLAYWMLRNELVEAPRDDVVEQIEIAKARISDCPKSSPDILQALLERSGVIRSPQHDIIDFVHRTFLEYLAASGAVKAADFGALVANSDRDSWREVVVFAVGHARGKTRDKFAKDLLRDRRWFGKGRTQQRVLAIACATETASDDIESSLMAEMIAVASHAFPPRTMEDAKLLAPAARGNASLLRGHEAQADSVVAACVKCAAIAGGEPMLRVIESYATCGSSAVWGALLASWPFFDEVAFRDQVIKKRSGQRVGTFAVPELSDDALAVLYFCMLKDLPKRLKQPIEAILQGYVGDGRLTVCEEISMRTEDSTSRLLATLPAFIYPQSKKVSGRQIDVTHSEAQILCRLRSLRHLELGCAESSAIEHLTSSLRLRSLTFCVTKVDDLSRVARMSGLGLLCLRIDDRFRTEIDPEPIDLAPLSSNPPDTLRLIWEGQASVTSSVSLRVARLELLDPPHTAISRLASCLKPKELVLWTQDALVDLQDFASVEATTLVAPRRVAVSLPTSTERLRVRFAAELTIANLGNLSRLVSVQFENCVPTFDWIALRKARGLQYVSFSNCGLDRLPSDVADKLRACGIEPSVS